MMAALSVLVTPGPTNTLLATAGAGLGFRRALPLLTAELSGYFLAIIASRVGPSPQLPLSRWCCAFWSSST
jgi:threonine/homoserine/homoserine lactone efflux protein